LPYKEMAVLSLQGLLGDIKYLAAQVQGHGTIRPPHHSSIAVSHFIPILILRVSPSDGVLNLIRKENGRGGRERGGGGEGRGRGEGERGKERRGGRGERGGGGEEVGKGEEEGRGERERRRRGGGEYNYDMGVITNLELHPGAPFFIQYVIIFSLIFI
jgi:hypothetical protein